jgi:hypothetical protein
MDTEKVKEALAVIDKALEEAEFQDWMVDNQVKIDEEFEEDQPLDVEEYTTYNMFALRKYVSKDDR